MKSNVSSLWTSFLGRVWFWLQALQPLVAEEMESLEPDLFPKVLLEYCRNCTGDWAEHLGQRAFIAVCLHYPISKITAAATKPSMSDTGNTDGLCHTQPLAVCPAPEVTELNSNSYSRRAGGRGTPATTCNFCFSCWLEGRNWPIDF